MLEPLFIECTGKWSFPAHCGCLDAKEEQVDFVKTAIERNIPPHYQAARLEYLPPALADALLNLNGLNGVYLWGNVGTGKSYAFCALARHYIENGSKVRRINYLECLSEIRAGYNNGRSEMYVLDPMLKADYLFLDDIGSGTRNDFETDHSLRMFYYLVNHRIEQQRPTYLSGNKRPAEMAGSFDSRIVSRLYLFKILEMTGPDKRILIRKQAQK